MKQIWDAGDLDLSIGTKDTSGLYTKRGTSLSAERKMREWERSGEQKETEADLLTHSGGTQAS